MDLMNLDQSKINLEREWKLLARIFVIAGGIGWFASVALLVERIQSLKDPTKIPSSHADRCLIGGRPHYSAFPTQS
jgi:hypothetical protein